MVGIAVVTPAALLIARRASTWTIAEHLRGRSPQCVAVDPLSPTHVYCGTAGAGLFRSRDGAGRGWKALDLPWPEPGLEDGVEALACLAE